MKGKNWLHNQYKGLLKKEKFNKRCHRLISKINILLKFKFTILIMNQGITLYHGSGVNNH